MHLPKVLLSLNLFFSLSATAQLKSTSTLLANRQTVTVNGRALPIRSITTNQQAGPNGGTVYTLTMDFSLGEADAATLQVLKPVLKPALMNGKALEGTTADYATTLSVLALDNASKVVSQSDYSGLILQSVTLTPLDATSPATIIVHAIYQASIVKVGNSGISVGASNLHLTSNWFRVTVGSLPCLGVRKIYPIDLSTTTNGQKDITLEMSSKDIATWNQAFASNPNQLLQGTIELLNPNAPNAPAVHTLQIVDAKIISVTTSATTTSSNAISTVVLRARLLTVK